MADKILTLCETCAEEIKIGGFRVTLIAGKTMTEKKAVCENCCQRPGDACKQYLVCGRGK